MGNSRHKRNQKRIRLSPLTNIQSFYVTRSHRIHWKGRDIGSLIKIGCNKSQNRDHGEIEKKLDRAAFNLITKWANYRSLIKIQNCNNNNVYKTIEVIRIHSWQTSGSSAWFPMNLYTVYKVYHFGQTVFIKERLMYLKFSFFPPKFFSKEELHWK